MRGRSVGETLVRTDARAPRSLAELQPVQEKPAGGQLVNWSEDELEVFEVAITSGEATVEAILPYLLKRTDKAIKYKLDQMLKLHQTTGASAAPAPSRTAKRRLEDDTSKEMSSEPWPCEAQQNSSPALGRRADFMEPPPSHLATTLSTDVPAPARPPRELLALVDPVQVERDAADDEPGRPVPRSLAELQPVREKPTGGQLVNWSEGELEVLEVAIEGGEATVEAIQPYLPNRTDRAIKYKLDQMLRDAEAAAPVVTARPYTSRSRAAAMAASAGATADTAVVVAPADAYVADAYVADADVGDRGGQAAPPDTPGGAATPQAVGVGGPRASAQAAAPQETCGETGPGRCACSLFLGHAGAHEAAAPREKMCGAVGPGRVICVLPHGHAGEHESEEVIRPVRLAAATAAAAAAAVGLACEPLEPAEPAVGRTAKRAKPNSRPSRSDEADAGAVSGPASTSARPAEVEALAAELHLSVIDELWGDEPLPEWSEQGHELLGARVHRIPGVPCDASHIAAWLPACGAVSAHFRVLHADGSDDVLSEGEARLAVQPPPPPVPRSLAELQPVREKPTGGQLVNWSEGELEVLEVAIEGGEATVEAIQPYLPNRTDRAIKYKLDQMLRDAEAVRVNAAQAQLQPSRGARARESDLAGGQRLKLAAPSPGARFDTPHGATRHRAVVAAPEPQLTPPEPLSWTRSHPSGQAKA